MDKLTLEQALSNIQVALDQFKGTKAEHIALGESVIIIQEELDKVKAKKEEE